MNKVFMIWHKKILAFWLMIGAADIAGGHISTHWQVYQPLVS